jgi:1-phosphofructokinase family hexose kinase
MPKSIYTLTLNPCFDQIKYTTDEIKPNTIISETKEKMIAGGKGVNVSKVLHKLGIYSKTVILAGTKNSKRFVENIPNLDLEIIECSGSIRSNLVITNGSQELKINQDGYTFGETEMARIRTKIWNLIAKDQIWILAGSLSKSIKPEFYGEIIDFIKSAGSEVWLDTSGLALEASMNSKYKPDLIKPNRSELQTLLKKELPTDWQELTTQIQKSIIKNTDLQVMLTMDKDGCLLVNKHKGLHTCIIKGIKAVNTVGAGDSFLAGLIASNYLGFSDLHALEFANCVANLTVSKTIGHYPTLQEVNIMMKLNFHNNLPMDHID